MGSGKSRTLVRLDLVSEDDLDTVKGNTLGPIMRKADIIREELVDSADLDSGYNSMMYLLDKGVSVDINMRNKRNIHDVVTFAYRDLGIPSEVVLSNAETGCRVAVETLARLVYANSKRIGDEKINESTGNYGFMLDDRAKEGNIKSGALGTYAYYTDKEGIALLITSRGILKYNTEETDWRRNAGGGTAEATTIHEFAHFVEEYYCPNFNDSIGKKHYKDSAMVSNYAELMKTTADGP